MMRSEKRSFELADAGPAGVAQALNVGPNERDRREWFQIEGRGKASNETNRFKNE